MLKESLAVGESGSRRELSLFSSACAEAISTIGTVKLSAARKVSEICSVNDEDVERHAVYSNRLKRDVLGNCGVLGCCGAPAVNGSGCNSLAFSNASAFNILRLLGRRADLRP